MILAGSAILYSCGGAEELDPMEQLIAELNERDVLQEFEENSKEQELKKQAAIKEEMVADSLEYSHIKDYKISLMGSNPQSGKTAVKYESLWQRLEDIDEKGKKMMWTKEKIKDERDYAIRMNRGGRITLEVERKTRGAAETKYFTIIVKDTDENEISRETLANSSPSYQSGNYWNMGWSHMGSRTTIPAPFYVYVVDEITEHAYKFMVEDRDAGSAERQQALEM
jgi:hypothetical protein